MKSGFQGLAIVMVWLGVSCAEDPVGIEPGPEIEAARVSVVTPTDRSFVSGQTMVAATATPLEELERIDFSLHHGDEEVLSRHVDGPLCEFLLDTSLLEDGVHRIVARALFSSQEIVEAEATVIVDNGPPDLELVSPQPGQRVFIEDGETTFVVRAFDLSSVEHLTMTVNGEPLTAVTSDSDNSYRADIDFDSFIDALSGETSFELELEAFAEDALGHQTSVGVTLGVASRQQWRQAVPADSTGIAGLAPSPDGEVLYVTTGRGAVHALRADTGEELCQFDAGAEMYRAPTVSLDGTAVYFGTQSGIQAISAAPHCTALWSAVQGEVAQGRPKIDGVTGTIFATTRSDGGQGGLHAVGADGSLLWSRPIPGLLRSGPTLALEVGAVVVASDDGLVTAVSLAEPAGEFLWTAETGGALEASVTYADGVLYVGSDDFNIYAFDAASGDRIWEAPFPTGRNITTSPALDAEGFVYVTSRDMNLYKLSPLRRLEWSYESVGGITYSDPVVADAEGLVLFGDAGITADDGLMHGVLHAVRLGSGERAWSTELDGSISVTPMIIGDSVYAGTSLGQVYAFHMTPEAAYDVQGEDDGAGDDGDGDDDIVDDAEAVSCSAAGGSCWPRECRSDLEVTLIDASCSSELESCCVLR